MEAREFRNVILFMANRWDKQTAIKIFGNVMGLHFWGKWCNENQLPDYRTMRLFYEMSDTYMQILLDYIKENYNG